MNASEKKQAAKDLRGAANVIEHQGFNKGGFFLRIANLPPQLSPVCTLGAISVAVSGHPVPGLAGSQWGRWRNAATALAAYLNVGAVSSWNDEPGRVSTEVTAALRACADTLEAN